MTAVHDSGFGEILAVIEQAANQSTESKGLIDLQREIYTSPSLRGAMDYDHGVFQVRDGLLENAKDDFLRIVGSWKVKPDELRSKTAESLNSTSIHGAPLAKVFRVG